MRSQTFLSALQRVGTLLRGRFAMSGHVDPADAVDHADLERRLRALEEASRDDARPLGGGACGLL